MTSGGGFLDGFRPQIERELREVVVKGSAPLLGLTSMYAYHMGFCDREGNLVELLGGKYLRPLLCLAMCAALGGDPEKAVPAAASLELGHRTSLIFDDIQDKGLQRNNRPTVWSIWGSEQAINAGLALSSYARLALQRLKGKGVPDSITLRSWEILEKATIDLCWGQYRDLHLVEVARLSVEDYVDMVRGKTASLFGSACELGALIASGDEATMGMARDFGLNMGIAFQIHDDYLGVWGDEAEVGKTANDLVERKRSLPVILAGEMAPGYPGVDRYTIDRWLNSGDHRPEDAAVIRAFMERIGVPAKLGELEKTHQLAAAETLSQLEMSPEWADRMNSLLDRAVDRNQ